MRNSLVAWIRNAVTDRASNQPQALSRQLNHDATLKQIRLKELSTIETRLSELLTARAGAIMTRQSASIIVEPVDAGFLIRVDVLYDNTLLLSFGNWSEEMDSLDQCWSLIEAALRGRVRLITKDLGGKPWSYIVLMLDKNGSWREIGGLTYVRFRWRWLRECSTTEQFASD